MSDSLVSCLMVTRDRAHVARRAVRCFAEQTWSDKELVVLDDGDEDYEPILEPYRDRCRIRYHRLPSDSSLKLGGLRSLSLDLAHGAFCTQWDDDEWYHPERIETQMRAVQEHGLDAVVLKWTLMHLDTPEFVDHPYRTRLRRGTPGTILHRRTDVRYPNWRRREDSVFLRRLGSRMRLGMVQEPHSHLFIRCFHGTNTWDAKHFTERLHYTIGDKLHYLRARFIDRDLFSHPAFQLTDLERDAAERFLSMSREMGLVTH